MNTNSRLPVLGARLRTHLAVLVIALVALLPGCVSRTVTKTIYQDHQVAVKLRKEVRGSTGVDLGYAHPTVIAAERLLHILARIDIETGDKGLALRQAVLRADMLGPAAKAMSEAFEQATPADQVIVTTVRKEHRLGIFHTKYLTSFLAYVEGEYLFVHFSRIDWEIAKKDEDKKLPQPKLGEPVMAFHVVPGDGMHGVGRQGVAMKWRDELYGRPMRFIAGRDKKRRREILLDSPLPADERSHEPLPPELMPQLGSETLRALAALAEAREKGELTELEYLQRRDELLSE